MSSLGPPGELDHWLAEARQGSTEALGRLFHLCRPYLLLVANAELPADVRGKLGGSDVVQQTFLEAHRDFAQFAGRTEGELLAWLTRILRNSVLNMSRDFQATAKRQVSREVPLAAVPLDELRHDPETPSGAAVQRERDDEIHRVLEQLPEDYRQVIRWRNYEGLSFKEVGRRLNRSAEAARKLWARALEQLQAMLEGPHDSR